MIWLIATCLLLACACVAATACILVQRRRAEERRRRVEELVDYLEAVSVGRQATLEPSGEDELSKLKDEMEKTVSALRRTRDDAVRARERYAHNLSNIAHQIKTPVTVMSLVVDRLAQHDDRDAARAAEAIDVQLERLNALQGDLLRLARIDAGAIVMKPAATDAFSLLSDVADGIEEQARQRGVSIEIVDGGSVELFIDAHWTFEALSNVMGDCVACSPSGSRVLVEYEDDPLCARIRIEDEGPGFSDEDARRIFERFYVGEHSSEGSTGLGLAFAREIVGLQGGTMRAMNSSDGGACFEIRFYRHFDVTLGA